MSNPTVTGILNRLEQKGYIRRIQSQKDKRVHYIEATEKAMEFQKVVNKNVRDFESKISGNLTAQEQETLFVLLEKVAKNLIMDKEEE